MFEVRGLTGKHTDFPQRRRQRVLHDRRGDQATAASSIPRTAATAAEARRLEAEDQVAPGGAFGSFINAVRSRKPEDNNCDAEVAHYSAACCHLANISYRLGAAPGTYDKARGAIGNNKEVVAALERIRDNCKAVGVPLDETTYTVGPTLTFDPKTERFTGEQADEANKLLTRDYRAPFVVPETV